MDNGTKKINEMQIVVRLKSFLNSFDQTDSPTTRELYRDYLQLNELFNRRLLECSTLLHDQQRIEAVSQARRAPALNQLYSAVMFSGRKELLKLADLYSWEVPAMFDQTMYDELMEAFNAMDDLRPLLAEFRRIARTDQVANKLLLLREIVRRDRNNPEWEVPLREVENKYVTMLIDEAQQVIIDKDFARLEAIYSEMQNSTWTVTIPTIVLQKINKVVSDYRNRIRQEKAVELLEKVNAALGSFDVNALEDSLICWNDHCSSSGYEPDENQRIQLKEAEKFLNSEREKQQKMKDFQQEIQNLTGLLDSAADLHEIGKSYAALQAFEMEIPSYITKRVFQYREDIERAGRAKLIIKSCKIIAVAIILITLVGGSAHFLHLKYMEYKHVSSINELIEAKDFVKAREMLTEVENKYPQLTDSAKISAARAAIIELEKADEERQNIWNACYNEVVRMQKLSPVPLPAVAGKIAELEKLSRDSRELDQLKGVQDWYREQLALLSAAHEELFLAKINELKNINIRIQNLLESRNPSEARQQIAAFKECVASVHQLTAADRSLFMQYQHLLNSAPALEDMVSDLEAKEARERVRAAAAKTMFVETINAMASAENIMALDEALRRFFSSDARSMCGAENEKIFTSLQKDVAAFRRLLATREDEGASAGSGQPGLAADFVRVNTYRENVKRVLNNLNSTFDELVKNVTSGDFKYVRLLDPESQVIEMLVKKPSVYGGMRRTTRDDGAAVVIHMHEAFPSRYVVAVGQEKIEPCKLIYPASLDAIATVVPPHFELIKKIFNDLALCSEENIVEKCCEYLQLINNNEMCPLFWKARLTQFILQALAPLDVTSEKVMQNALKELENIIDASSAKYPLYDKTITLRLNKFFLAHPVDSLIRACRISDYNWKFIDRFVRRNYIYLGYVIKEKDVVKYCLSPSIGNKNGEVYCFDETGFFSVRVGSFSENGLMIQDDCRDKVVGKLLFIAVEASGSNTGNGSKNIPIIRYPEFWPKNLTEDK